MPAPFGNQNAAKAKRWEAAIVRALEAWPNQADCTDCSSLIRGLNEAAHKFVKQLMSDGDIAFYREVGDRLDGKPAQTIAGDSDNPLWVGTINRNLIDPKADRA